MTESRLKLIEMRLRRTRARLLREQPPGPRSVRHLARLEDAEALVTEVRRLWALLPWDYQALATENARRVRERASEILAAFGGMP